MYRCITCGSLTAVLLKHKLKPQNHSSDFCWSTDKETWHLQQHQTLLLFERLFKALPPQKAYEDLRPSVQTKAWTKHILYLNNLIVCLCKLQLCMWTVVFFSHVLSLTLAFLEKTWQFSACIFTQFVKMHFILQFLELIGNVAFATLAYSTFHQG